MLKLARAFLILLVGAWMGAALKSPDVEYRVRTVTETETVTEQVKVPTPLPESCESVIELADRMTEAAVGIDSSQSEQLEILSEARMAIFSKDNNRINNLDTRQRELKAATLEHVIAIAQIKEIYPAELVKCKDQM